MCKTNSVGVFGWWIIKLLLQKKSECIDKFFGIKYKIMKFMAQVRISQIYDVIFVVWNLKWLGFVKSKLYFKIWELPLKTFSMFLP